MTAKDLLKAAKQRPFRPFILHLSSGQSVTVNEEHNIGMASKNPKRAVVFDPKGDYFIVDLAHIASLQGV